MATVFEIHCVHDDASYAQQAAHAAFELLDRLEQELSRFVANSDVARINELREGESALVSPSTLECLAIARHMFDLTAGAFDVSIGTGLDRLDLREDDFRVEAHADGIRLDLGGIGKGYAVDAMVERLEEWEVRRALVHGGFSSVRALDAPPEGEGWPLTLSAPWGDQRVLARVAARQMALSASGTRKGDHIRDPRTGRAAPRRAAWTAVSKAAPLAEEAVASREPTPARLAAVAEGLSTAFMLLALQDVEALCRHWPEVEAWLSGDPEEGQGRAEPVVHFPRPKTGP
jgi:thiamine biosynthesis lipoprotein